MGDQPNATNFATSDQSKRVDLDMGDWLSSPDEREEDTKPRTKTTKLKGVVKKKGKTTGKKKKGDRRSTIVVPAPALVSEPEDAAVSVTTMAPPSGNGALAVAGVSRITISPKTQQLLGCVIGENVTSESPWVFIDKGVIEDSLFLHSGSSDFLPIKDAFTETTMPSLLIGYDALNDKENQFYICLTEKAQDAVLTILEEMKLEQQRRLENALEKKPRPWQSLGSEEEVQLFTIRNHRPFMRVLVETRVDKISKTLAFSDRDVEAANDGYFCFPKKEDPPDQIWCYRLEAAVQVRNPRVDAETQTDPYIPDNSWTQYEYAIDTEKPIEDEQVLTSLAEFLAKVETPMTEVLKYNEILDNYRDDYAKLVASDTDTDISQINSYAEFMSFTDMKHCQGKAVSCVTFHPMWSGIVALGYVEQGNVDVPKTDSIDGISVTDSVHLTHRVLIWSLTDAFKPKLILDSPREVYSLAFAPHREELLVGGLSSGQIVLWDIKGKIERVEQEIKLTPEQIRHNMAMMNMMDWMKHTIHIQYVRPVAVSSLEHSHSDIVTQVYFLHPRWEVNRAGQFEPVVENRYSTQLVSASLDSSILTWNLDPSTNPAVSIAARARKRKTARRPDGLKAEVSPYALFHRALAPAFKVELSPSGDRVGPLFRSMAMCIPDVKYERDKEEWEKLTTRQKESPATRFIFTPNLTSTDVPVSGEQEERAIIGTSSGQLLAVEWKDVEPRGTTIVQSLHCQVLHSSHIHDGPILKVVRSPFYEDVYLTIEWGKFAIWSSKLKNKPFLWRKPTGGKRYISGSWSEYCPTVFRLCASDGSIEAWDLATRSEIYSILQNVSGKAVTVLESHPRPLPTNLIGLADFTGCFRLFFIPVFYQEDNLCGSDLSSMVDREVARTEAMNSWVNQWKGKHSEEAKRQRKLQEQQETARAREEEMKQTKSLLKRSDEKVEVVEKQEKKSYPEEQMIRKIEQRRKYMLKMMMERKKIDREDLERKRAPLVLAQEALQLKQLKKREVQRNKNAIFKDTVHKLFPEITEKPPPVPTDCEVLAAQLDEMTEKFMDDYREIEARVLLKIQKTSVVDTFNWKRVVQEGKSRREVLDLKLYHQNEWKQRAEERRTQRRLHRDSELRHEDETRKKKGINAVSSSSGNVTSLRAMAYLMGDSRSISTDSALL